MKKIFSALFLALLLANVRAAPLTHDLGQGLTYHRAHVLPAELPSANSLGSHPCVLDLRYTAGDSAAATALSGWLKFRSDPRAPVFILVNSATSSVLFTALAHRERIPGLVVLGAAAPGFTPDITLTVPPDTERRAYDALENGATIDSLLNAPNDKPRNDEAKLARERQPDNGPETPPPANAAPALPKPATPPPLIDLVLQRAVHLHRALLALKKI